MTPYSGLNPRTRPAGRTCPGRRIALDKDH